MQEIDIKKQGAVSSYAFCQYSDISSVVKAMRSMDGEHLGSNRIKLGFGKSMPTSCVWVDGIGGKKNNNLNKKMMKKTRGCSLLKFFYHLVMKYCKFLFYKIKFRRLC